ncbi:MAG: RusA family crossover junction endodeoxyribonuclease [Hyalangium sp.]|uniref:RusA family crossover junction endodeoxyribonuclease n=1 Tax=Hyalangium sp. TaxID=2028555 RepID=UPI00389A0408
MSVVFRAVLPIPPSVNESLQPVRLPGGALRLAHTAEARRWASKAHLLLLTVRRPTELRRGPLAMRLKVHVATIASDGGNRLKLLEDALVKARVIGDDRQIAEWEIVKVVGDGEPRVEVELRQASLAEHPELAQRLAIAENKQGKRKAGRS